MTLVCILASAALGTATMAFAAAPDTCARLIHRRIDGFPEVAVPVVSGPSSPAARRINSVLDADRRAAIDAVEACRPAGTGRRSVYRRDAQIHFNRSGLLSIGFSGANGCRGDHIRGLPDARTFDLGTGSEIDLVSAIGLPLARLIDVGSGTYDGPAECKSLLMRRSRPSPKLFGTAYLTDRGVTIPFDGPYAAVRNCLASPVTISFGRLRATTRLAPPLSRL